MVKLKFLLLCHLSLTKPKCLKISLTVQPHTKLENSNLQFSSETKSKFCMFTPYPKIGRQNAPPKIGLKLSGLVYLPEWTFDRKRI